MKYNFWRQLLQFLSLNVLALCAFSSQYAEAGVPAVVSHGSTPPPAIVLTFDVEGNAGILPQILDILAKHDAKATFFILGTTADQGTSAVLPQILAAGHELGNHSYSHPRLLQLSPEQMREEIIKGQLAVQRAVNQAPSLIFRPPYGEYDDRVLDVLKELGYTHLVMWDIDPKDWAGTTPEAMSDLILQQAKHGSIVLFHDFRTNTPTALKLLLPQLKERGFQFLTFSELIH